LIQCVPAFLIAIHWSRLRAGPVLCGVAIGTLFAVGLTLAGHPRISGIHVGVLGCLLNAVVAVSGSLVGSDRDRVGRRAGREPRVSSRSSPV
ncbi:MAG: hypothetical protein ACX98W_13910, partial [bacterium]